MTLEALFARAEQGRAFLMLAAGGAALGALMQLAGLFMRAWRPAGMAADLLCALSAGLLVLWVAFQTGSGLRAYALLGLMTGLALYRAGIRSVVEGAARWACRIVGRAKKDDENVPSTTNANE